MTPEQEKREHVRRFRGELLRPQLVSSRQRRLNAAAFKEVCLNRPEQVAKRVLWVMRGHYGQGAYLMGKQAVEFAPEVRARWFVNVVAALDWSAPPPALRSRQWATLFELVNATIEREIADKQQEEKNEVIQG